MDNTKCELAWKWYLAYLKEWAEDHAGMEFFGQSPACYQEWLDNEMEEWDDEEE